MNWRSVAEHVCETAARPLPPKRRTREPMATSATASPAAAVKRGFTDMLFGGWAAKKLHLSEDGLEDQAAVRAMPLHADALVDPDGGGVFGPDEQTDRR